jgi:hypothetical protein
MRLPYLSYESAAELLYKMVMGKTDAGDLRQIEQWTAQSVYNRCLVDDLRNDNQLRTRIMDSYYCNHNDFWKIIVAHRSALHVGMPRRTGNFWQRLAEKAKVKRKIKT